MVLRMETGAINRGACIAELSQYPGEKEYLWVPCSFLEPRGAPTVELVEDVGGAAAGVVTVVPVHMSANLKTLTVEELRSQKKDMHLAALRYMLAETARDLERIARDEGAHQRLARDPSRVWNLQDFLEAGRLDWLLPGMSDGANVTFTVEGLLARIGQQCEAVVERHAAVPAEAYAEGEVHRGLVTEMLETKAAALSTLRSYIEDPGVKIEALMRESIAERHRIYLAFLERTLPPNSGERAVAAGRLCRAMGAMQSWADEEDAEGFTRLMRSAADGAGARVLRALVAAGGDVNRRDAKDGKTALYLAAEGGHAEVVQVLARLGGDVNAAAYPGVFDATPIYIAAQEGHTDVIEVLGRFGADVHRATKEGAHPLFKAAEKGHVAALEALARLGGDVNRAFWDGRTPMYIAAEKGHVAAVEALGRLGADVSRPSNKGWTPMAIATEKGHTAAAEALRRLGAES
jgi:hypothetical protein